MTNPTPENDPSNIPVSLLETEKTARAALEANPRDDHALYSLAMVLKEAGQSEEALNMLNAAVQANPQMPAYLVAIGELLASEKMYNQSALAYLGAQELDPENPEILTKLAEILRLLDRKEEATNVLQAATDLYRKRAEHSAKPTMAADHGFDPGRKIGIAPLGLDGFSFQDLHLWGDANGSSIVGVSMDGVAFIKIELRHNPYKKLTLEEEGHLISDLNQRRCMTCPVLIAQGKVARSALFACMDGQGHVALQSASGDAFAYLIQRFIPATTTPTLGDILLAVLEQKSLGVFHADLRLENCRMDEATGLCYLVDYDQAERLDKTTQSLENFAFFEWCNRLVQQKYSRWNFKHFLHYFPQLDLERDFKGLFRRGAFNLASTRLFANQKTTAAKAGIYHTLDENAVYIEGERSLDSRKGYLDQIEFTKGERVLDVGCSSGLVSFYLARRGCKVHGIDLDAKIIRGCKILANILGGDVTFEYHDLDQGPVSGEFETVLLFSVIHHTKNLLDNARHIARQCKRILIECRLVEGGMKPTEFGGWEKTSGWAFQNLDAMKVALEQLFPGFVFVKNHGMGDRDRYLLEYRKPG